MSDIRESIARAVADAGLAPSAFRLVGHTRWESLLNDIVSTFTTTSPRTVWLWEHLKEPREAARGANALVALPLLLPHSEPVWFIAEAWHCKKARSVHWVFETNTKHVLPVLQEHHHFEFYVVSKHLQWMVGENHHDTVFCVGEPMVSEVKRRYAMPDGWRAS